MDNCCYKCGSSIKEFRKMDVDKDTSLIIFLSENLSKTERNFGCLFIYIKENNKTNKIGTFLYSDGIMEDHIPSKYATKKIYDASYHKSFSGATDYMITLLD